MNVKCFFPNGHYHSPVVDPLAIPDAVHVPPPPQSLLGIPISIEDMLERWTRALPEISRARFGAAAPLENKRFHLDGPFPFGDALFLKMQILLNRPSKIIEIGSGFSTACMLDAVDEFGLDTEITCVEPYPARLKKLLGPEGLERVTLIEEQVQNVPLILYNRLGQNDILFIDSSHVLKTASDVNFELFEILPQIAKGVAIQIHDCRYPFEYPKQWMTPDCNYSWNEAYAIRAFLMYNEAFKIEFWGSLFKRTFRAEIQRDFPSFLSENPGTSLWLRRVA
ncbi:class I SAM-dependent methyltransferase [Bradyrhizobium sp. 62]|uniref:class I SAM-dependent methyltransferase n=1 Tax=Bradyrhizobium sp. 62 TaxID=1043588 RepID=UPI001FF8A79C|nr:class I SAM-dependent methyltransferase [Bradyrhizobium sp. 62]MCK1368312.1 class I SAM-dependent methyltransferase [Bradyrhizobium sp. 62]